MLGRNENDGFDFEWTKSSAKTFDAPLTLVSKLKAPVVHETFVNVEGAVCLSEYEDR